MKREKLTVFPVNLLLAQQPCLVVGGGRVAAKRIHSLLAADAAVTVMSPSILMEIEQLVIDKSLKWIARPFTSPEDIASYILIIAATNDAEVNQTIARLALQSGKLCNVASDAARGNFIVPSVVRWNDHQIAISTSGTLPGRSKGLREALEDDIASGSQRFITALREP